MFIKLGKTNIVYNSVLTKKYIVFSQIVDSSVSYETPVLVRNEQELKALFTSDFRDYGFLKLLLKSYPDTGLYLYKPISATKAPSILEMEGYIDYSNFNRLKVSDFYPEFNPSSDDYIKYLEEWKNEPDMAIPVFRDAYDYSLGANYYWIRDNKWEIVRKPTKIFKGLTTTRPHLRNFKMLRDHDVILSNDNNTWVYCSEFKEFVLEDDLPQNINDLTTSRSLDNRCTLFIPETDKIDYIQPNYRTRLGFGNYSGFDLPKIPYNQIRTDNIRSGRENVILKILASNTGETNCIGTLAFIEFDYKTNEKHGIVITNGENLDVTKILPEDNTTVYKISSTEPLKILDELKTILSQRYTVFQKDDSIILTGKSFIDIGYNTFNGIVISPDIPLTQDILYNSLENKNGVSVWSKTIGGTKALDEDGIIKVRIEAVDDQKDYYTIIITRYDYSETFTGTLQTSPGIDRLDRIVEKNSKLIHMKISEGLKNLKIGTYELSKGVYSRIFYYKDWMTSLKLMFEDEKRFQVDFLLIPNIEQYVKPSGTYAHYKEYETILKYCKESQCQALIQNDKIYNFLNISSSKTRNALLKYPEKYARDNEIYYFHLKEDLEDYFSKGNSIQIRENGQVLSYSEEKGCYYVINPKKEDNTTIKFINKINFGTDLKTEYTANLANTKFADKFLIRVTNLSEVTQHIKFLKSSGGDTTVLNIPPNTTTILQASSYKMTSNKYGYNWDQIKIIDGYYSRKKIGENKYQLQKILDSTVIRNAVNGGNFIFNYTTDFENYLIYFYGPEYSREGTKLPGYYAFIDGFLEGNYSAVTESIMYNSPESNSYAGSKLGRRLEKYKSNFLSFNGYEYYYKKYFDSGDLKITSVFLRFIIGKISRELDKEKYNIIGEKVLGSVQRRITEILAKIEKTFSIVKHIKITKLKPDFANNTLNITLSTAVENLVDKDVTLNITLNVTK